MSVEVKARFDREMITRFSNQMQEPEWVLEHRLNALEAYDKIELPKLEKTKIDNWNIDQFEPFKTEQSISSVDELPDDVKSIVSQEEGRAILVQKNASVIYQDSSDELKKQGVIFTDLHTAMKEHGDLVQKYFAQAVKADEHKLSALHHAMWNGGVFIYVPKNTNVELPLQSLYWMADEEAGMFPHVIIVAEDNSSVTYVDNYISLNGEKPSVQNNISEVYVGKNARVRFSSVRTLAGQVTDYTFRRAVVDRDGRVDWILGELNDGDSVADNTTVLEGDGSYADTVSVAVGTGEQRENITSQVRHFGKHSESYMVSKGAMLDNATAIFNGITKIEKGATKSHGEQAENVLMLNEKSRGDANPILLIDEDDVTAGHAASVGQIDENQVYYLMSRGVKREEAERLIIRGFLNPVVQEIPLEGVRERVQQAIERKLP